MLPSFPYNPFINNPLFNKEAPASPEKQEESVTVQATQIPSSKLNGMRTIINESLQTFQICLLSPKGNQLVTLGPKKSMTIKQSEISQMILNLARRKIVKII